MDKAKDKTAPPEICFAPRTKDEAANKAQQFVNSDMVRYYIKKHHGMLVDLKREEFYEYEVDNGQVIPAEIPSGYVDASVRTKVVNLILAL